MEYSGAPLSLELFPKGRLTMLQQIARTRPRGVSATACLASLIIVALATGCAGLPEPFQPIGSWFSNQVNRGRTAGAKLLDPPQKVSGDFDCPSRPQPWVLLQTQELWPPQLSVSDELAEKFVYVLCPARGQAELRGTLTRRVRTRGQVIWSDAERDYELKPGRWVVELFLTIPAEATAGSYEFEVSFETNKVIFRDVKGFTVVRR